MKYYFLLIFLFLFSGLIYAESFYSKQYNFNLKLPLDWEVSNSKYNKSVTLTHADSIATINVTAYRFKRLVTANELQKIRMGKQYDGWIYLLERKGSLKEMEKSNVNDVYVGVYAKDVFDSNMNSQKLLVGEYYFVTGNYGYIVTVTTFQDHWMTIKPVFQSVLDSFWVGSGVRKQLEKPKRITDALPMSHYNIQNNQLVIASPNIQHVLEEKSFWMFDGADSEGIYPVIIDDIFVFMLHNRLIGISLRNLSVQWEFESASKIDSRLIAHNNLISFIRYGEQAELLSLDIVTGEIVNKVALKMPVSVPVIYQGRLFLMMNNTLVCLDSVSKRQYWKKRLSLDFEVLPIVSAGKLIVATDLGKIAALDIDTGKLHWTYQSGVLLQRGLVAFGNIIIWVQLLDSSEMVLNALNTNTGNLNWQSSLGMTSVSHLPLVDKQQVYIFGEGLDQNSVLNVFDLDKGNLNFNVLIGDVLPSHRPVLLSGLIVFIADNQYWLLDQFTGDFFKSKVYKYQLLDHYFYKQWVVQWQKQADRYKLSFNM